MKAIAPILGIWLACQTGANLLFRHALSSETPRIPAAAAGILLALFGLGLWLLLLRRLPLAVANNYTAILYLTIPLGAQVVLGEAVSGRTWLGALLIAAGILATGAPGPRFR